LPFETLLNTIAPDNYLQNAAPYLYRRLPYLVRTHTFEYLFTAALLTAKKESADRLSRKGKGLLVVSPVFVTPEEKLKERKEADSFWLIQNATPLPGARQEAVSLQNLYLFSAQRLPYTLLLDTQATESCLKALDLGAYRYIHWATHGFFGLPSCWLRGNKLFSRANLYSRVLFKKTF
jgi:CHAT domain-containing protein